MPLPDLQTLFRALTPGADQARPALAVCLSSASSGVRPVEHALWDEHRCDWRVNFFGGAL